MQINLATACDKNAQQQGDKNNVDLQTKWLKATWTAFEETNRPGRNRLIKAKLLMDDGDNDDDDDDDLPSS